MKSLLMFWEITQTCVFHEYTIIWVFPIYFVNQVNNPNMNKSCHLLNPYYVPDTLFISPLILKPTLSSFFKGKETETQKSVNNLPN